MQIRAFAWCMQFTFIEGGTTSRWFTLSRKIPTYRGVTCATWKWATLLGRHHQTVPLNEFQRNLVIFASNLPRSGEMFSGERKRDYCEALTSWMRKKIKRIIWFSRRPNYRSRENLEILAKIYGYVSRDRDCSYVDSRFPAAPNAVATSPGFVPALP